MILLLTPVSANTYNQPPDQFFNRRVHRGGNAEGAEKTLSTLCVSSSAPSVVKKTLTRSATTI